MKRIRRFLKAPEDLNNKVEEAESNHTQVAKDKSSRQKKPFQKKFCLKSKDISPWKRDPQAVTKKEIETKEIALKGGTPTKRSLWRTTLDFEKSSK